MIIKPLANFLVGRPRFLPDISEKQDTGKVRTCRRWLIGLPLIILLINSCSSTENATFIPRDTTTSTLTQTSTLTVVWFPPTATSTPFPTPIVSPTLDYHPDLGNIILRDDFSAGDIWDLGRTSSGSIALGNNELTITLSSVRAYVFTVRAEPVLDDFYLEITASPTLCRGEDEYGILIRFSTPEDFYRFSLSCDGRTRLDKIINGKASSPQPWISIGAIPSGAPSISRLAVWANGKDMRFFINDIFLFSAIDSTIKSSESPLARGRIGLFVRSASDMAVTVNFSDLIIRQINQ